LNVAAYVARRHSDLLANLIFLKKSDGTVIAIFQSYKMKRESEG
jgi:hypothetical protein